MLQLSRTMGWDEMRSVGYVGMVKCQCMCMCNCIVFMSCYNICEVVWHAAYSISITRCFGDIVPNIQCP